MWVPFIKYLISAQTFTVIMYLISVKATCKEKRCRFLLCFI